MLFVLILLAYGQNPVYISAYDTLEDCQAVAQAINQHTRAAFAECSMEESYE